MEDPTMKLAPQKADSYFRVLDRMIDVYSLRIGLATQCCQVPMTNAMYQPLADELKELCKHLKNTANNMGERVTE